MHRRVRACERRMGHAREWLADYEAYAEVLAESLEARMTTGDDLLPQDPRFDPSETQDADGL